MGKIILLLSISLPLLGWDMMQKLEELKKIEEQRVERDLEDKRVIDRELEKKRAERRALDRKLEQKRVERKLYDL